MTDPMSPPGAASPVVRRPPRHARSWNTRRSSVRRPFVRFAIGVAGLVVLSATASAHDFGHGDAHGGAGATFAVVLALPALAGLIGGVAAVRYRHLRGSETDPRNTSILIGLLIVGLGVASLLSVVTEYPWLSVAGGAVGAVVTARFLKSRAHSKHGCGNHATITFGAISAHRVLEGVILGVLYSTGAAIGVLGAVVLAGHTMLETAAVGGLYATATRRIWTVSVIVLVQAAYIAGAFAGFGVASAVPGSVQALTLALVGGALLIVGVAETNHSFDRERSVLSY